MKIQISEAEYIKSKAFWNSTEGKHTLSSVSINKKIPLNQSSKTEVSFKGSSLIRAITGFTQKFNYENILNPIEKNIGSAVTNKFNEIILYAKKFDINNPPDDFARKEVQKVREHLKKCGFSSEKIPAATQKFFDKKQAILANKIKMDEVNKTICFQDKGWMRLLGEYALYPVTKLPFELIDFSIKQLRKIPALKESDFLFKIYNSKLLKKRRFNKKVDIGFDEVKGWFEVTQKILDENKKSPEKIKDAIFIASQKMASPKSSNYSSTFERPLNRVVSGLIPAFFLANDAYNLSALCGDDKKISYTEHKTRYKQEVSRIMSNAYIQLFTIGAFSKLVNSSPVFAALTTAVTVLFSETYSRLKNGKSITFISEEKAKKLYDRDLKKESGQLNTQENEIDNQAENKTSFKAETKKVEKEQKLLFTTKQAIKAVSALAVIGVGLSTLKNNMKIDKLIRTFFHKENVSANKTLFSQGLDNISNFFETKVYNKLTKKEFNVDRKKYDFAMEKLRKNGFEKLAQKYDEAISPSSENIIKVISKDGKPMSYNKKIKPVFDFIIEPFNFIWGALQLPYKIVKSIMKAPVSGLEKKLIKTPEKITANEKRILDIFHGIFGKVSKSNPETTKDVFVNCIPELIKNAEKLSDKEFEKYISKDILSSGNKASMSSYKNSDMALLTRIVATLTTAYFLIADNYNMVMMKSQGKDKSEAKSKAKERAVQETSRLFYATLFQQLFNNVFSKTYNNSLIGMSAVTTGNVTLGEYFTRASIGIPIKKKTREEILFQDEKNAKDTGFKGKYFRFMSKLTGKKPLAKRIESSNNTEIVEFKNVEQLVSTNLLDVYMNKA